MDAKTRKELAEYDDELQEYYDECCDLMGKERVSIVFRGDNLQPERIENNLPEGDVLSVHTYT